MWIRGHPYIASDETDHTCTTLAYLLGLGNDTRRYWRRLCTCKTLSSGLSFYVTVAAMFACFSDQPDTLSECRAPVRFDSAVWYLFPKLLGTDISSEKKYYAQFVNLPSGEKLCEQARSPRYKRGLLRHYATSRKTGIHSRGLSSFLFKYAEPRRTLPV